MGDAEQEFHRRWYEAPAPEDTVKFKTFSAFADWVEKLQMKYEKIDDDLKDLASRVARMEESLATISDKLTVIIDERKEREGAIKWLKKAVAIITVAGAGLAWFLSHFTWVQK